MSPEPSRRFRCETYLLAFAGGARDGLVREHIDNCDFCRDIVHGGTEEFPLSYAEELEQRRAEHRRASRRRFIKVGVAGFLGLAAIGTTGVVASRYLFHPTDALTHKHQKKLDKIYAIQGRAGILATFVAASPHERREIHAWIGERGHAALLDFLVEDVNHREEWVRGSAILEMRQFSPQLLSPWKSHLVNAKANEPVEELLTALEALIATIP